MRSPLLSRTSIGSAVLGLQSLEHRRLIADLIMTAEQLVITPLEAPPIMIFGKVGFGEMGFGKVGFGEMGFGEVGIGKVGIGSGIRRSGREP